MTLAEKIAKRYAETQAISGKVRNLGDLAYSLENTDTMLQNLESNLEIKVGIGSTSLANCGIDKETVKAALSNRIMELLQVHRQAVITAIRQASNELGGKKE